MVGDIAMQAKFGVERIGVSAADQEFSRWGWAFREQPILDYGIDAHVEVFTDGKPSGRSIALQIKSGSSWFDEPTSGGWVFRESDAHLLYWLRHSLPVVLLLHNPESGLTYWQHVTQDKVEFTDFSWKLVVPESQLLDECAFKEFEALAESAPGASDDPVEASCALLPPVTAEVLKATQLAEPGGTLRLAAWLARGRATPRLTVESVLSRAPRWLSQGSGRFEVAVATYAVEHGHPDLAATAWKQAAAYNGQPADMLLAFAALSAAEANDIAGAQDLMRLVRADIGSSLLLTTADAVVRHLGQSGPVPVPESLLTAAAADRAAVPTCLAFLGVQALRRGEVQNAVNYFEEAIAVRPASTSLMLQLGQALQLRVGIGLSGVPAEDLRRIETLAEQALLQRRRWSGPSSEALVMLIRRHAQVGAFEEAVRLACPLPDGAATAQEACADEVVILGAQIALILRDEDRARTFACRAQTDYAKAVAEALLSDKDLLAEERANLWLAVHRDAATPEIKLMAWYRLAGFGIWPLPELDELLDAGEFDAVPYDILHARAMAASGDLTSAVSVLRVRASKSPMAAEALVDVLQDAGRFEEALDEAARGFERFGEAVLAHKQLNLLVLADQPDAAASEAISLLARPDTAPELRLRTRRRLIGHYAHRGDWTAVEMQARAALAEFPGTPDLQWSIIGAAHNQGRPSRAHEYFEQFNPKITTIPHARWWMSLLVQSGFSSADVTTALDLLDRWPDEESFETQVLGAILGGAGRSAPDGAPILPELDPKTLGRFQSKLMTYTSRHPDGPIRAVSADPHDLADLLRAQLAPHVERVEMVRRLIREGRVWLGVLAAMLSRSYIQALVQRACGVIGAVTPDPPAFVKELEAASVALDQTVIVELSAVCVATLLRGRWPQLRGAFAELRCPLDARADFQAAREDMLRDPESSMSIGYDPRQEVLVSHQLTHADHKYLVRRLSDIDDALSDLTMVATPGLGLFAELAADTTDVSLSPLALAAHVGVPLWSDDVVLRALAHEQGIPAFGTLALLHVLVEAERLPDTLREDVLEMAREYVVDFMLTQDELLSLAAEGEYKPGPAAALLGRPVFWADPASAQDVFLELISAVQLHAADTIETWFRAACTGLATRNPDGSMSVQLTSLAETVSTRVAADDKLRGKLIQAADEISKMFRTRPQLKQTA